MTDYPHNMTLRPIERWPHEQTASRVVAPFTASLGATLELLNRELRFLSPQPRHGVADSVMQIAMREGDFRSTDGMPKARAIASHPGVILAIESKHGALSYPCDKFTRWQDNLRAIALSLEALRKVDRYGVSDTGQQYTGWAQLTAAPAAADAPSVEAAETLLRRYAHTGTDGDQTTLGTLTQAYRRAVAATHPDRPGGDRAQFERVQAAADVLRTAGRLS